MLKHYLLVFVVLILIQQNSVKQAVRELLFLNKTATEYTLGESIILAMVTLLAIFAVDTLVINDVF